MTDPAVQCSEDSLTVTWQHSADTSGILQAAMSILAAQMQFRSRISRNLPGNSLSLAVSLNFGWDDFGFESVLKITDAEIITAAVPEPSGLVLMGIGLPGLAKIRKKYTGRMPQSRQSA